MENQLTELACEAFCAEREWTLDGVPVLCASVSLPRPLDRSSRTARRIDRFYQAQGRAYLQYCGRILFPQAAAACREAMESSGPLPCCTASLTYRVTCSGGGFWSLYTQTRECVAGQAEVLRRGDVWDLRSGYPAALSAFFPPRFPIRRTLLAAAETEIRHQEESGSARYHDRWRQELRRTFSRDRFYLAPDGLRFFWQMNAIAPRAEGVPVFSLPFSPGGCRLPPPPPGLWSDPPGRAARSGSGFFL